MPVEPGADPLDVALPYPDPPVPSAAVTARPDGAAGAEVVLSGERLRVGTEWVVAGRVRVRRRIVTERRTVEVEVRREIVEFDGDTVDFRNGRLLGTAFDGPPLAAPPAASAPFVAVLREEVPVVSMAVRPYEQVTLTTTLVRDRTTVGATLQHEQADVVTYRPDPAGT